MDPKEVFEVGDQAAGRVVSWGKAFAYIVVGAAVLAVVIWLAVRII